MDGSIERLRTPRLVMRRIAPGDLDDMAALFALPEVVAHRPNPEPDSAAASSGRLDRDLAHWRAHGFGRWAVACDGRVVGFGGLSLKADVLGLNLSYHLHPAAWGRGYAGEIVEASIEAGFAGLGAPRIVGMVRPANPRSARVLERAGFVDEGDTTLGGAPIRVFALTRARSA